MNYQNYEEYMQNVLGYNPMQQDIYTNTYNRNNYYEMPATNVSDLSTNEDFINTMYPEIYRIVYPMVCKSCNHNRNREITKELIDEMCNEIYTNLEEEERQISNMTRTPLKNGDVRNPNVKETETKNETRQGNFLLRDLIRILILRELLHHNQRPPMRPPMPHPRPLMPPMGPRPPMRPPMMRNEYEYY